MVLGVLAVLSGFAGNSAVLVLGIVAIGLGARSRNQDNRAMAMWGVGVGALALLGYVGILINETTPGGGGDNPWG
jgi:hypothetical protein